jgi:ATP-dependent exoDNAse (exonuclease V) alpha subunit
MNSITNTLLNNDQQNLFDAITTKIENIIKTDMMWDNITSLIGPAGTGKTYLTTKLIENFIAEKKYTVATTTPTHKALSVLRKNLSNSKVKDHPKLILSTIHSFLNIKLVTDYNTGIQKFIIDKNSQSNTNVDLLIVDESSMVSKELYKYIIEAIEMGRIKAVLFVGDKYQLLPVNDKNQILDKIKNTYKLTKIVRQVENSYIIKIATKARKMIQEYNYTSLSDFFNQNFDANIIFFHGKDEFYKHYCKNKNWTEEDKVITSFKNSEVDTHNKIIRNFYWQSKGYDTKKLEALQSGDTIVFQDSYVIKDNVIYHNGDIVTINYAKKEYLGALDIYYWRCKSKNGNDFNVVDPYSTKKFKFILSQMAKEAKNEKNFYKKKELWTIFYHTKDLFANIKYNFASTMHKLQGSTYESVYIDLMQMDYLEKTNKDELFRLLYVSLTRASKNIIILIPNLFEDLNKIKNLENDITRLFGSKFLLS